MKVTINAKLKPCPFCGGKAQITFAKFDYNFFGVFCRECEAYVYDPNNEKAAIDKWNKRITERKCRYAI